MTTKIPLSPIKSNRWSAFVMITKIITIAVPQLLYHGASQWVAKVIHSWTYISPTDVLRILDQIPEVEGDDAASGQTTRNIVIIGGSWGGYMSAKNLAHSIPSGYRVVVIERNETYQHLWNFPRYTALPPHPSRAARAFVPTTGITKGCPQGAIEWVTGEAVKVVAAKEGSKSARGYVELSDGRVIPYHYLIVATGADNSRLEARTTAGGCAELAARAGSVAAAKRIVIIGGGAVGVELATDIRSKYGDEKTVYLIHSREQLLDRFGIELHNVAMTFCKDLGVQVILGERPEGGVDGQGGTITLPKTGEELSYDLLIKCIGGGSQKASTSLRSLLPASSFNERDGRIKTSSALQVIGSAHGEVFALGDVSDIDVPGVSKMARAAFYQSKVLAVNVVRMIKHEGRPGKPWLKPYSPIMGEDSIKLTVGLLDACTWMHAGKTQWFYMQRAKDFDLDAKFVWRHFGVLDQYPDVEESA